MELAVLNFILGASTKGVDVKLPKMRQRQGGVKITPLGVILSRSQWSAKEGILFGDSILSLGKPPYSAEIFPAIRPQFGRENPGVKRPGT